MENFVGRVERRQCCLGYFGCILVLLLAGCAVADNSTKTASSHSTDALSAGWNPDSWTSDIEISPKFTTEEEKLAFRDRWLQRNAEFMELKAPPSVSLVEWQKSLELFDNKTAECLRGKGFGAHAAPQGGITYDPAVPAAQRQAFDLSLYECQAMYFPNPEFLENLTEDQLRVQWDYWDEYYIPCLAAHGLTVDTSERPARETYVAGFNTDPEHRWWPDNGGSLLLQIPSEVWKKCPNIPPESELYGLE
ncbi:MULTISPECIES: hypothetical protein [Actinotignum]|uniref:Uncharacterized protein n=1 Tax=Actinotignum timonense TaxID=1870995 RepID=A0AAW9HM78_9ACTO|nr:MULTISPECIES: hypothetical protein [Actinotignum]MDE1536845.1 hypothetical protein [Actinotignum schaalii]MDE1557519.1 hypothetical protein [Actinotignum schaalii]MDE1662636.1 hypothetical protein [Actinotignum schaalii]MDK6374045.1 hypothetical protein [Actinotignum timonense]MDK6418227.1 hypothetical protein [Actinotignum timonense]